jgi:hypothetical protein
MKRSEFRKELKIVTHNYLLMLEKTAPVDSTALNNLGAGFMRGGDWGFRYALELLENHYSNLDEQKDFKTAINILKEKLDEIE